MTLPTKSNSAYPDLHLDAFESKLRNLNLSKIEHKRETKSDFHTQFSHQYTSHIYGILIQLTQ